MTGTAVQEIVALEDSLTLATRPLDVDALDRIYADDIIMTSVLGEPCGKTVVLDEAKRGVAQRQSAPCAAVDAAAFESPIAWLLPRHAPRPI